MATIARSRAEVASWSTRLAAVLIVAVVVSPVVVGGLSLIGDTWLPMNDWSHMVFRVSQVGTTDTPLVGPYSVHGWAHPGPLVFWLTAPLYRLTGGDPRALLWTATIINCASVAGLGAVAWRRGRWPLLAATMALSAMLINGLGPLIVNDLWNPYIPLLPFLLTIFLVWDAALGRHRALLEAILPATLAAHSHVAFVPLMLLLLAWFAGWLWLRDRLVDTSDGDEVQPLSPRAIRLGLVAVVVLWSGPLLDAVFDRHNPFFVARTMVGWRKPRVGPIDALGLVGRYVRPDGPWAGGDKPQALGSVVGSGPLPLLVALGLLVGCLLIARRRGLVDVAALASLSLVLVVGAVSATGRIIQPAIPYLTEWLSVIGALVWFTVGWTLWRLQPRLRLGVGVGVAVVAIVGATAFAWGPATRWEPARTELQPLVEEIRADLADRLPKDRRYRVELRGDYGNNMPGVIFWMLEDGYDVLAVDGDTGRKWGRSHVFTRDSDYETMLVVAAHVPGSLIDSYTPCAADPDNERVADYDALTPADRRWLEDFTRRSFAAPDEVTAADRQRAQRIEAENLRVGVFITSRICGTPPRSLRP